MFDRVRDCLLRDPVEMQSTLRLGIIYTVAPYLLPDLIPELHAAAPQMPLDIEETLTENLETGLRTGRVDAAIIALPFDPPGVVTEFLYEEPFQVVVPHGHKWTRRRSIARTPGTNSAAAPMAASSVTVLAPARHSTRSACAKALAVSSMNGVSSACTPAAA